MKSKKIEFTIYSGIDSEIDIKKIDVSLSILPIDSGGLRWKFLKNKWLFKNKFLWQFDLIKVVLSEDYDSFIFLGSPYHISTWIAAMIARLRRKKVFYWMHGVYKDKITLIDYLKLFVFYKIANGFFLYGNRSFEILNKYRIKPAENINIIYNSLDYKKSFEFRKEIEQIEIFDYRVKYFNDKTTPIIVFIGRLNYTKRLDMLIEAQDNLRNKYKKNFFNILIIGDGEEMLNLVELSKKKEVRKKYFFFRGYL
ncbi:glycosyltransferase [Flavobacterium hibisci]|uniref:glycosyltransferase n=1 Tax=Flavobacterium hibisci TaxID=1914462 RepID=UPI0021D45828|nr:glycosyltransferase [Flavobacterium hibisci]MBZ4043048.1 glycosyltransferase [Flavobacterium hibisci]